MGSESKCLDCNGIQYDYICPHCTHAALVESDRNLKRARRELQEYQMMRIYQDPKPRCGCQIQVLDSLDGKCLKQLFCLYHELSERIMDRLVGLVKEHQTSAINVPLDLKDTFDALIQERGKWELPPSIIGLGTTDERCHNCQDDMDGRVVVIWPVLPFNVCNAKQGEKGVLCKECAHAFELQYKRERKEA